MKLLKNILLLVILIGFFNCKSEVIYKVATIEDIEYLLIHLNDENKVSEKIDELGFTEKTDRIYISKYSEKNLKPASKITVAYLDLNSMVSFETNDEAYFDSLVNTIMVSQKIKEVAFAAPIKRLFIGKKFTYEVSKPGYLMDTSMDKYYKIIIYRTK